MPSITVSQVRGPQSEADRRADRRSGAILTVFLGVSLVSRGLTESTEAARAQFSVGPAHLWVLEATSHLSLLAVAPLIVLILNHAPLSPDAWKRSLPLHALAGVVFSLAHVALMWPARLLLFPLVVGYPYTFNLMSMGSLQYELTKDLVTYAFMVAVFVASRIIERRASEAREVRKDDAAAGMLTLPAGGATVVVAARDIEFAKAADNYVEIHAGGTRHLVRMTLSNLEARLTEQGHAHARVHRSYIVNTAHVRTITPTGEGDVKIVLASGSAIPGSRRYRGSISMLEAR